MLVGPGEFLAGEKPMKSPAGRLAGLCNRALSAEPFTGKRRMKVAQGSIQKKAPQDTHARPPGYHGWRSKTLLRQVGSLDGSRSAKNEAAMTYQRFKLSGSLQKRDSLRRLLKPRKIAGKAYQGTKNNNERPTIADSSIAMAWRTSRCCRLQNVIILKSYSPQIPIPRYHLFVPYRPCG